MKIGNLHLNGNLFLAPMAGITDAPLRSLFKDYGCALCFSEMISSEGLVRQSARTLRYLDRFDNDDPFAVQLFGSDPEVIAASAQIAVGRGARLIDVNMGCPAKKIIKNRSGSALMREPDKVKAIVKTLRAAVDVPLTVKIRSGWRNDLNAERIAVIAEDQGADAIIVHPRTVEQGFSGKADWRVIKSVKACVKVPVIGNGDIAAPGDALSMMQETGCDGVMVGRGALGYPWIFNQIQKLNESGDEIVPPGLDDRRMAVMTYFDKLQSFYGLSGLSRLRIRLSWFARGVAGSGHFRKQIIDCDKPEELFNTVSSFFRSTEPGLK